MSRVLLTLALVALIGCHDPRNDPQQQIEDFKACKSAGMDAYQGMYGGIFCRPAAPAREE